VILKAPKVKDPSFNKKRSETTKLGSFYSRGSRCKGVLKNSLSSFPKKVLIRVGAWFSCATKIIM